MVRSEVERVPEVAGGIAAAGSVRQVQGNKGALWCAGAVRTTWPGHRTGQQCGSVARWGGAVAGPTLSTSASPINGGTAASTRIHPFVDACGSMLWHQPPGSHLPVIRGLRRRLSPTSSRRINLSIGISAAAAGTPVMGILAHPAFAAA